MTTTTTTTTTNKQTAEEMVQSCMTLVRYLAHQYASQTSVSFEDLVSEGYIGLMQASRNFDESRGAKFSTFATTRIRGAILDAIRRAHPLPRPMAEKVRALASFSEEKVAATGCEPTEAEVAQRLQISTVQAGEATRMRKLRVISLDVWVDEMHHEVTDESDTPEGKALKSILKTELRGHVAQLVPRDREIIQRIYWDRQNQNEVAHELGISESRISQIQTRALGRLRGMMESDYGDKIA